MIYRMWTRLSFWTFIKPPVICNFRQWYYSLPSNFGDSPKCDMCRLLTSNFLFFLASIHSFRRWCRGLQNHFSDMPNWMFCLHFHLILRVEKCNIRRSFAPFDIPPPIWRRPISTTFLRFLLLLSWFTKIYPFMPLLPPF